MLSPLTPHLSIVLLWSLSALGFGMVVTNVVLEALTLKQRRCWIRRLYPEFRKVLSKAIRALRFAIGFDASIEPLQRRAHELLARRRLTQIGQSLRIFSIVLLALHVVMLLQFVLQWFHGWTSEAAAEFMSGWLLPQVVCLYCGVTVLRAFRRSLTSVVLDLLHVTMLLSLALHECTRQETFGRFSHYAAYLGSIRFAGAVLFGDLPKSILLNMISTTLVTTYFALFGGRSFHNCLTSLLAGSLCISGCLLIHSWMYSFALATVESQQSKISENTAHRILSAVCDAIVYIDANYTIYLPAPKLASLLLHTMSGKMLQGSSFLDLLDAEDVARFTEYMDVDPALDQPSLENGHKGVVSSIRQHTLASSLHVRVRDSDGSYFRVQLFHVSFQDIEGQLCHMIGLQEDTSGSNLRAPPNVIDDLSSVPPIHRSVSGGIASIPENSSVSSASSAPELGEPMHVCVDVRGSNLDVLMLCGNFAAVYLGCARQVEFLPLISSALRRDFLNWIRGGFLYYDRVNKDGEKYGDFTNLKMCTPESSGIAFTASLSQVVLTPRNDRHDMLVMLMLTPATSRRSNRDNPASSRTGNRRHPKIISQPSVMESELLNELEAIARECRPVDASAVVLGNSLRL